MTYRIYDSFNLHLTVIHNTGCSRDLETGFNLRGSTKIFCRVPLDPMQPKATRGLWKQSAIQWQIQGVAGVRIPVFIR